MEWDETADWATDGLQRPPLNHLHTLWTRATHQVQCEREWKELRGNMCAWPVTKSCPTLLRPMHYSPSGSSVHGISQARTLEWVAMPSSRRSSRPRDGTCFSCTGRQILYHWTTRKPSRKYTHIFKNNTSIILWAKEIKLEVGKSNRVLKEDQSLDDITQPGSQHSALLPGTPPHPHARLPLHTSSAPSVITSTPQAHGSDSAPPVSLPSIFPHQT